MLHKQIFHPFASFYSLQAVEHLTRKLYGYFRCPGDKINTVAVWLAFFQQLKHVVHVLMFVMCLYFYFLPNELILIFLICFHFFSNPFKNIQTTILLGLDSVSFSQSCHYFNSH